MARHVRDKVNWGEGSKKRIADKSGLFSIISNILGINHHVNESASSMRYGRIVGFEAHTGVASAKEPEALLRRARMLR